MKTNAVLITNILITTTLLSGTILASTLVSADNDSVVDEINITVPVSCSISGTGMNTHNANISNGLYVPDIGTTTLHAFCNDNEGFAIYAAGYTGNEVGGTNSNKLVGTTASSNATIESGIATSAGNPDISNWAMKLTITQDSGDTSGTNAYTIDSAPNVALPSQAESGTPTASFSTYHVVPNEYTKVAHKNSGTDMTAVTGGVKLTTTYAAYISKTQPADTYSGQVKYTLVYPADASAPRVPITIEDALGKAGKTKYNGYYKIQDMNSAICSNVNQYSSDDVAEVIDIRDNSIYHIAKLADDNCWMLDNLALDLTNNTVLGGMSEANTNASNATLSYLKYGGGTTSDKYAIDAVSEWATNPTYSESHSFSDPLIATDGNCYDMNYCADDPEPGEWTKDSLPPDRNNVYTHYGVGSGRIGVYYNYCAASAGSYCYGDGDGNEDTGDPSEDATEDICPKNWRMPTGGYSSSEYGILRSYYDSSDAASATSLQYNLSISLSGYFYGNTADLQGREVELWSSSYSGEPWSMNILTIESDKSNNYYESRYSGISMRCIVGS